MAYVSVLSKLRFDTVEMLEMIKAGTITHSYASRLSSGVVPNRKRLSLLTSEMASLQSSLPVTFGSSIFIRVDETRLDLFKVLIIGPAGSPYENGVFEFDILCPPNYPDAPPSVLLITTGGGKVRFNPNLYNCGKVCLSLLGTWQGPGWISGKSTLLQVRSLGG